MTSNSRCRISLEELWMPFTSNRSFKQAPRLLSASRGMYYTSVDGRSILDGCAGLWCVNAGHCREQIVSAITEAASSLDFAPSFNMGHPLSFALATELAKLMPGDIDHVFFTNSGSEAVDSALKIVLAYWRSRGQPERVRFVGRQRAYHGVGFGGISVGGIPYNQSCLRRATVAAGRSPAAHARDRGEFFTRGQPQHGANLADELENIVAQHGAETIAAVIVEPVAGSTGVLVPPVGYLERLRAICDKHGILLIFDEVITGFGRTGAAFGAQKFGVLPDMMTVAKGITNGAVPMGAVGVRREIYDTVVNAASGGIEFFHGYTYSGHPLASAAGLATLRVYREEGLFERAAELAPYWEEAVHSLRGLPHVVDIRNIGLVAGVELESREGKPGARGLDAMIQCFNKGLLVRVTGDIVALSPPLIIEKGQIDHLIEVLGGVLKDLQ